MPLRSTGSSSPTATASSADFCREEAMGSQVKVRFSQAAAITWSGRRLPVMASMPSLTTVCASAGLALM